MTICRGLHHRGHREHRARKEELFLGLSRSKAETATGNAQASCCRAFSPSDRADGPTARSTGLQPCVTRCRETRPERSPARFDPTFASDLTGRGFVGLFLGLKAQALCCRAFSPSDRAATRASALRAHFKNGRGRSLRAVSCSQFGFWNLNIGSYLEIGSWKFPARRQIGMTQTTPPATDRHLAPVHEGAESPKARSPGVACGCLRFAPAQARDWSSRTPA